MSYTIYYYPMNEKAKRVIGLALARKSNSQTKRFRHPIVSTPKNRNANSPKSGKLENKIKTKSYFEGSPAKKKSKD